MASSVQYRIIDLQGATWLMNRRLELLRAEVPSGPYLSPFAVVRYAYNGKEQSDGLRLDLDKGVFLDHFEDSEQESYLQSQAPAVVNAISSVLKDQVLNQLPMPATGSSEMSRASRGPSHSPKAHRQHIFICYEGSEDAQWARMFQEHLQKNLPRERVDWHITSMNVASTSEQMVGWEDRLAREITSCGVIIILFNERVLSESAPSRIMQTSISDAYAHGVEVVAVFTGPPYTSKSSFRKASRIFKSKPHLIWGEAHKTLHDVKEQIEEALGG